MAPGLCVAPASSRSLCVARVSNRCMGHCLSNSAATPPIIPLRNASKRSAAPPGHRQPAHRTTPRAESTSPTQQVNEIFHKVSVTAADTSRYGATNHNHAPPTSHRSDHAHAAHLNRRHDAARRNNTPHRHPSRSQDTRTPPPATQRSDHPPRTATPPPPSPNPTHTTSRPTTPRTPAARPQPATNQHVPSSQTSTAPAPSTRPARAPACPAPR